MTESFAGDDAVLAAAKQAGKLDYDTPFEGSARARSLHDAAQAQAARLRPAGRSAQARWRRSRGKCRDLRRCLGIGVMANPVGTGPYRLTEWRRGQKIVLEANPSFREEYFPESSEPGDRRSWRVMKGKRLPPVGRVEISIIEESNPRLLAFQQRRARHRQPRAARSHRQRARTPATRSSPNSRRRGSRWCAAIQPTITFDVLQHGRPGRRRLHEGEGSRCGGR